MDNSNKDKEPGPDASSLEQAGTTVAGGQPANGSQPQVIDTSTSDEADTLANGATQTTAPAAAPSRPRSPLPGFVAHLNIYLLLFILLIIISGATGTILYLRAKNENVDNNSLSSQSLSQSDLDQLANTDVTVGQPKHTLNVQSNAVFNGSVLVRSNLQIAGNLQVGSSLAINGIRVTGNSVFDDVQITKSLAVTGSTSFQGGLVIQQSLNVNGTANFLGAITAPSLTVGSLQMSGDLDLTHHISAGGATPSRNNGTALGGGGTVSVSGSDTAGTITINTGSSPGVGCFVSVTFATKFNATPHIVMTPIGSAAALVGYYVNRSTTGFSVCGTSAAPGGTTFGFDYIAFD